MPHPCRASAIGVAALGLTAGALAQVPPETMDFALELFDQGGNSNGIVEPGETVGVRVRATITPGIGAPTLWNNYSGATGASATVYSFAASIIDLIGTQNSGTGALAYAVPPELAIPIQPQFNAATQSITGANAAQLVYVPTMPGNTNNPVIVLTGTWTPTNYAARTLAYSVNPTMGAIYLTAGLPQPVGENTSNTGSQASIQIVPTPASVALIGLGGLLVTRRRR